MKRKGMGARQIYEALRDQIVAGTYEQGDRLPSSRALALELGVSRTTVTVAYEQLLMEGFITVPRGARPRVSSVAMRLAPRAGASSPSRPLRLSAYGERIVGTVASLDGACDKLVVDFRYGDLSPADFPYATWKRAVNVAMMQRKERLAYGDSRGSPRLRSALQGYLWRARTLRAELDQIIIVNGTQQGLDLCARLLLDVGDRFVIEQPCYPMARQIFASTGASGIPISVDDQGLDSEAMQGVRARLAYVTPSHQFPLGAVMSVSRRYALLEWAERHDAYIIEDDYDSEFRYDINPVPPLHSLSEGDSVIYVGTVSKTLSPTLRIGFLVVPPALQAVFTNAKLLADRHSPLTEQDALASLIESGAYERHVRGMRRIYAERRTILLKALLEEFGDAIAIEGAEAGLHIVVWFKEFPRSSEELLTQAARAYGVGVYSVSRHYGETDSSNMSESLGLVMGYAALDGKKLKQGVGLLAKAVRTISPKCADSQTLLRLA